MSASTNGVMTETHAHVTKSKINAYMRRVDVDSLIVGQNEQQHEQDEPHSMHFTCFAKHEKTLYRQLHMFRYGALLFDKFKFFRICLEKVQTGKLSSFFFVLLFFVFNYTVEDNGKEYLFSQLITVWERLTFFYDWQWILWMEGGDVCKIKWKLGYLLVFKMNDFWKRHMHRVCKLEHWNSLDRRKGLDPTMELECAIQVTSSNRAGGV